MKVSARWFGFLWAVGISMLLLWLPMYGSASSTLTAEGPVIRETGSATLVEVNGSRIYGVLSVPVLAAALALIPMPSRLRRPVDIAAVVIAIAFVIVGMMSIGWFFAPTAAALAIAASTRSSPSPARQS